jgi:hypothetical protein
VRRTDAERTGLIEAIVKAFAQRATDEARPPARPGETPAPLPVRAADPARAAVLRTAAHSVGSPLDPSRPRSAGPPAAAADEAARAEGNLVRGLFATPQTVAAALIAAEILAPPVALRDR